MKHEPARRAVKRIFFAGLAALCVMLFAGTAFAQLTDADVAKIPAGSQPIKFSHKVHAGDNKIDCQYCHIYARRSQVSGAPPVAICAGCHRFVATNLMEVKKVMKYWEDKKPIPWVKIHDIPDFVHYTHRKHVNAHNEVYPNGIKCQDCHGPIETMDVVKKYYPNFGLMGWCINCHLTIPGAKERKRAIPAGPGSNRVAEYKHPGGNYARPNTTDCLTCHY